MLPTLAPNGIEHISLDGSLGEQTFNKQILVRYYLKTEVIFVFGETRI